MSSEKDNKGESFLTLIACLVGLGVLALLHWAGMSNDEIFDLVKPW